MKLNWEDMKAFLIKNKTYVIIAAIFVVMIFTLVKVSSKDSNDKAEETNSEKVITVDETTTDATDTAAQTSNDLQTDAYPAVNELVNKYFTAMASSDIDTLLQIVNPLSEDEKTQIQQKKEYIEGYDNITCYTKIGPEENSYIVFVYYEIKFININTLVPGEIPLYICSNEDGSLYIYNGELSPEVDSYISNIAAGQDVVDLISSIDTKFAEAQENDPDLKEFIAKLSSTTEDSTQEQPAEEQPQEEQPAQEEQTQEQPAEEQTEQTATEDGLEEVSETVYAAETVNVRESSSEDATRLGQLYVGESAKRTGIYSNGWSRIEFNGQTGYVLSECLTTQGAIQETKYLSSTVNIREQADESSSRVGTAYEGTKVTRTAVLDNGWSKINCDGVIGYVKSEYLADTYK
ncbi:SH3 domain-containing protein [Lachnotalea glycerini]|uniref:SH3 domain-containing protein n=1 Tax=Lachnotalea glycerini TaxID=1763509 RepID=A0A255II08_9FIRM|nr:SH3 domain-containing protein [Lachnotalea glycerini]PXV89385.1 SH3 domain-containing protein [Lachnotalea glycerini]RDY32421.1 SH3 domain-containing protein [Lachnotalea glycerini]